MAIVDGKKRTGKTTFMTLAGYMAHLRGIPIASNYHVNYPHLFIKNSKDFGRLRNCLCLLDDFNKWASSRITQHKKTVLFSSVVNDAGKNNVSIIYSTKYIMQITKPIRHETDYVIRVKLDRSRTKRIPLQINISMFEFAMDMLGEEIWNGAYATIPILPLFDTSEVVKQL